MLTPDIVHAMKVEQERRRLLEKQSAETRFVTNMPQDKYELYEYLSRDDADFEFDDDTFKADFTPEERERLKNIHKLEQADIKIFRQALNREQLRIMTARDQYARQVSMRDASMDPEWARTTEIRNWLEQVPEFPEEDLTEQEPIQWKPINWDKSYEPDEKLPDQELPDDDQNPGHRTPAKGEQ